MFKIGELSKRANISVSTIRFYEEKGLIYPAKVDQWTKYRYYDESSIVKLNEIAYFKNLGFSLEEILKLDEQTIKNKIDEVQNRIKQLRSNVNILSSIQKEKEKKMKKSQLVNEILKILEENHKNLYHSVAKEEIKKFLSSVDWDHTSEHEFNYNMLKLFSKFKDSQTNWVVNYKYLDRRVCEIEGKLYLEVGHNFYEILKIGEVDSQSLIKEFKSLLCYETEAMFNRCLRSALNNGYYYELLNIAKDNKFNIIVKTNNGEKQFKIKITNEAVLMRGKRLENYSFDVLDNNVLYIQYFKCKNAEKYPFEIFVADIKKEIEQKNIKNFILDLRGTREGGSVLIQPLKNLIIEKQLNGVLLINDGTAGCGVWAVYDFKKNLNVKLIGEATGGATKRYGETKHFNIENYVFTASLKLFDITDVFNYSGSIKPDIFVPETKKAIEEGIDTQLEVAIQQFV